MPTVATLEQLNLRAEELNEIFDITGSELKKLLRLYGASNREFGQFIGKSTSAVWDACNQGNLTRRIQLQLADYVGGVEQLLALKKIVRNTPKR